MTNKIKKWVIAVAIAIVFNLFVNYGVATFYPGPEYSDYCDEFQRAQPLKIAAQECEAIEASEELQNECTKDVGHVAYKYDSRGCATEAYCETCNVEYDAVRKVHDGNVFAALLIVAVAALAAGIMIKVEAVSTGFLLGGILGLIIASMRYWEHLQNIYRFILLGIALAVLIWLGYKKVK
ncbi:hypothetical protein CMO88_01440 [Candidatus Woesearchaeota archaeon]|nr:hypothetical protein [Candidatus Woesearchaeota archaeon]|tara:strand:- start:34588 stop:35127 length:540 start_codon:yes stop_codon:yes gene_type:complete